jgi:lipid-binding SYLF domain-containing protein
MRSALIPLLAVAAMAMVGCESTGPNAPAPKTELQPRADASLQQFLSHDPALQNLIDNSAGYVVFPEVGKGAVGVGGASGLGTVYKGGQAVGTVKLDQVSVGPQLGGETYSELIIFRDEPALNRLMNNAFEFGAAASATIVKAGAATDARFDENGTLVYILPKGGLMAGADIHGQKFQFYDNNGNDNKNKDWNKTNSGATNNDVNNNDSTSSYKSDTDSGVQRNTNTR